MNHSDEGFVSLFNGRDLTGWFATPRSYGALWAGGPTVADVAPGLLPDDCDEHAALATYGDFELIVEANAARGHIAFEVHDNDTRFGERRWGRHAWCRWRNIGIRVL